MMKAILLSIKPEWLVKLLNCDSSILIRKLFPKDYVGWVYLYCTKEDSLCCIKRIDRDRYICGKDFDLRDFPHLSSGYDGKGKVVARFWCDKVEEIYNDYNTKYNVAVCSTVNLFNYEILEKSCLQQNQLTNYLKGKDGYAIHISKLEIFDDPKELSEFRSYKVCNETDDADYDIHLPITKAPQNYCYIEGE